MENKRIVLKDGLDINWVKAKTQNDAKSIMLVTDWYEYKINRYIHMNRISNLEMGTFLLVKENVFKQATGKTK